MINRQVLFIRVRAHTSFPAQAQRSLYQQRRCSPSCRCACHKRQTFTMPVLFHNVIGNLFVGYSGSPVGIRRCTEDNCLSQSSLRIDVFYLFPSWLFMRALSMTLMRSCLNEVSIALKLQRVIPVGSEIFRLTNLDDVDNLKQLFNRGLASPDDIDPDGTGALTVCNLIPFVMESSELENCPLKIKDRAARSMSVVKFTFLMMIQIFLGSIGQPLL